MGQDILHGAGVIDDRGYTAGCGHVIAHQPPQCLGDMDMHIDHTGEDRLSRHIPGHFSAEILPKAGNFSIPHCNVGHFADLIEGVQDQTALQYSIVFHGYLLLQIQRILKIMPLFSAKIYMI